MLRFLKNADAGSDNGSQQGAASDSQKDESGTQKTGDSASDSQKSQQGGQSDSAKGSDSKSDAANTDTDIDALKARLESLEKEKKAANAEAARRRKEQEEQMRKNGDFENLLKERETELITTSAKITTLEQRIAELEGYEKQVKQLEKTERDNLLKEIPKEDHAQVKDWPLDQLRFFIAKAKTGLSGQQSQGSGNGGKPAPVKKGGVRGAIEDYYNSRR